MKFKVSLSVFLLCSIMLPLSCQAKMVSIDADKVNLRAAPSTNSRVKWMLGRGFPLQVVGKKGKWLQVRDFEDDVGWVYEPLTSRKQHMVVKKKRINIRYSPTTKSRAIAKAEKGVVFRTLKQVKGWVKVRHKSGTTGWVYRKLVWGW